MKLLRMPGLTPELLIHESNLRQHYKGWEVKSQTTSQFPCWLWAVGQSPVALQKVLKIEFIMEPPPTETDNSGRNSGLNQTRLIPC